MARLSLKLSKSQKILFAVAAFQIWILLGILLISNGQSTIGHVPTEDQKFESNAFNAIANNWSVKPHYIYQDPTGATIPITYTLVDILGHDYPCANEQLVLLNKQDTVIPTKVNFATSTKMSLEYPSNIPNSSYIIHSHPLQTCGDFSVRNVATFPSPADLMNSRNNNIDDIIVLTKVSNETAIATRVKGFKEAPIDIIKQYNFVSGLIGYNEITTLSSFENANITSDFFILTAKETGNIIIVTRVTSDQF